MTTPRPGSGPPRAPADATLVDSGYRIEIAAAGHLHAGLNLADIAHMLTLHHQGTVPTATAATIVAALLDARGMSATDFPYRPEYGELYNSRERYFHQRVGPAAGWLNAGRTRREAVRIAFRIRLRAQLLELMAEVGRLARVSATVADRHRDTIMPDYTYLQQAQPTSFGHYLLSFTYPMLRYADRLDAAFDGVNSSPAGVGAVNGSRLLPDRSHPAQLLGFDRVITHTRDAMWQLDGLIDALGTVTGTMIESGTLAEDLEIFASSEFDFVRLADGFSRSSISMPQKSNPYALSIVRGASGVTIGAMTGLLALAKSPSARSESYIFAYHEVPTAVDRAIDIVRLMTGVVGSLTVNEPGMAAAAAGGYSQAADLAEYVVQRRGVDYRTAHTVVGEVVRAAAEQSLPGRRITAAMINTAAMTHTGTDWGLDDEELQPLLDPARIVASRTQIGGAAPARVAAMASDCAERAAQVIDAAQGRGQRLADREAQLIARAQRLVDSRKEDR